MTFSLFAESSQRAGSKPSLAAGVLLSTSVLSAGALVLLLTPAAMAQSFHIQAGQTLTTQQLMNNAGDKGVIDLGGTLTNSTGHGVFMDNIGQSVTNNGLISTTGDFHSGIVDNGWPNANNVVVNTGKILTNGFAANGIDGNSANFMVTNSGLIEIQRENSIGIRSGGVGSTITNSGTITIMGDASTAISADGAGSTVINSGAIDVVTNGTGIQVSSGNSSVVNSGTINVAGPAGTGIVVGSGTATVTNSGTIIAARAVRFSGGAVDNVLNLERGSVIQGSIEFNAGTDTLNVAKGMSLVYQFDKAPDVLNTNGGPSVVLGNTVAVVDTSDIAARASSGLDIVEGTFSVLTERQTETKYVSAYAAEKDPWPAGADWESQRDNNFWTKAFGGYRQNRASGSANASSNLFGGAVAGLDRSVDTDLRVGGFVGLARGRTQSAGSSAETNSTNIFGGIYGSYTDLLDFGVTGSFSRDESRRQVLNNLVVGGIETASAGYNAYLISPEITVNAGSFDMGGVVVRPSIRGRYVYQHIDGYAESGTASNLTIGARDIHTIDGRAQLTFGIVETAATMFELQAGVDVRLSAGADAVNATLLGQSLNFNPGSARSSASIFGGAHVRHQISNTAEIFASAELTSGSATTVGVNADAGLLVKF